MKTQVSLFDEIRDAAAFVAANAEDVRIDEKKLAEVAKSLNGKPAQDWNAQLQKMMEKLSLEDELRVEMATGFTNARYWRDPKWETKEFGGALLLLVLYIRAMEKGILWSSKMSCEDYWNIIDIGTGVELPRWKERRDILAAGAKIFEEKFDGSVFNFLQSCDFEAGKMADTMLENFPSFRDIHNYKGRRVQLCKLLQLTIWSIHRVLLRRGKTGIRGVEQLTAMPDYKLPQILRHLEVLRYSDRLAQRVDNKMELALGSPEEIEIRACMVQAVEKISKISGFSGMEVDNLLWLKAQEVQGMKPYHRTDTLFY
jgi:hypothetical protein